MNRQRRFQDDFAPSNCRVPGRGDEYDYNNSRTQNYSLGTRYNNDFAINQSNDYQLNGYNYSQYNQGPSGHNPRYSDSSKAYSDLMNCDASYDSYTSRNNNRNGNFQDASFQSSAFGGSSDSLPDYQDIVRSSGWDCSKPPNRSSWGSMGESSDETRKRHYPDESDGWGRDMSKQKRVDSDSVPLDLTRPQRHDTTQKLLNCKVCDMTFDDVEMFQVHANTLVHINNAALAVEKTLAKARPPSLVANLLPAQKSLLGPVPNRSPLDRNSFGNVANNQKNVSNQFIKRSPQISTQGNATDFDDRTGFIKPLLIYPTNNNNNNRQRNNKQMMGPNQNVRFKSEQSPQPDRAKYKPRNGFGSNNAFRPESFPQKTFHREQSKWKKFVQNTPNFGDFKKESQVLPKPAVKSSVKQADGVKVESEATSSKPDSSSLLFAAEEVKSESEIVALEYEDNMDIELNFKPSLSTSKVCDASFDDLEAVESAKESEVMSRTIVDPEGEDAKTGEGKDKDVPLGQEYVVSVTGFFCKLCSKFYNKESMAKIDHCKSDQHIKNYRKVHSESKDGRSSQDTLPL